MTVALLERPAPVDDGTRRELLAAGLALSLGLAACGGDDGGPARPTTRRFVDGRGVAVRVPARPERIVALNSNGAAQMLTLGVSLVGLTTREGRLDADVEELGLAPDVLAGVTPVGDYNEPDVEAIAALRPDLIVGHHIDGEPFQEAELVERLEQIAPTVFMTVFAPVDEVMRPFGELLGVDARVEEQQRAYERRIAELRERLPYPARELTVASVYLETDQLRVNGRELGVLTLALDDLGVSWASLTDRADAEGGQLFLSYERVGRLDDADVVFRHAFSEPSAAALGLFERLPAGRAGQVHDEPNIAAQTYPTLQRAVAYLEPRLLDADPQVVL